MTLEEIKKEIVTLSDDDFAELLAWLWDAIEKELPW